MPSAWAERDVGDLDGHTALVTGANAGLGFEVARLLAEHGARVLLACRDPGRAERATSALRARGVRGPVETRPLDLASLASIDALTSRIRDEEQALSVLVNNAGLMGVDRGRTADGFEVHFGVNHLGHFALTAGLLPVLLRSPGARVVTMSSMGHHLGRMHFDDLQYERRRYSRWGAYVQSKLANLLFTAELDRRLGPTSSVRALAAHPGASSTRLGFEGAGIGNAAVRFFAPRGGQSAAIGARPAVRAATDPTARGGELYGPRYVVFGVTPVRETPSRRARRPDDARTLWSISERLIGREVLEATPRQR